VNKLLTWKPSVTWPSVPYWTGYHLNRPRLKVSHCYGRQANYDLDLTIPNYVLLPYPGHRGIGQDEIVDMLRERDKFTVYISFGQWSLHKGPNVML